MTPGKPDVETVHEGSCHCGAIRITLTISWPPEEAPVRACDCSFCRAHGARTITDPSGLAEIRFEESTVLRYRFGLKTADFLVCRDCGVYVAATADTSNGLRATVNVTALEARASFNEQPSSVNYDGETPETRLARRAERWTPATIAGDHVAQHQPAS